MTAVTPQWLIFEGLTAWVRFRFPAAMGYFFFGTLMDQNVMEAVIGRPLPTRWARPATLPGYRRVCLREEPFPVLVPAAGMSVSGIVVDWLTKEDIDRVLFFESVEYAPRRLAVDLEGGDREAVLVFADSGGAEHGDASWDFTAWKVSRKAEDLRLTRLWMAFYGRCDIATANRLWDEALAVGRPLEDLVRSLPAEAPMQPSAED